MAEFVEGWLVAQLLGEGAYGEVRLLVHGASGARVALKAARGGGAAAGAREAALHRALRHPHVLRCLGARAHRGAHYTFLEYAAGGELFDRIEPDAGVRPPARARRYWRHLLLGLRYLHERGVAHRDIKPENLLLDALDRLKISDFGMATVFRAGDGRERLLARVCGTVPYAAPEVLHAAARPYRAPPADAWAAGVVLHAMLTGELPWERAHHADARYAAWAAAAGPGPAGPAPAGPGPAGPAPAGPGPAPAGPARVACPAARALLRRVLQPAPERRAAPPQLLLHRWTTALAERSPERGAWRSQPAGAGADAGAGAGAGEAAEAGELSAAAMEALISRSQPAAADELLASLAPGALRMTRVWVRGAGGAALGASAAALRAAGLAARELPERALDVECERELRMRARAVRVRRRGARAHTLLEFRRWRGCGMHFRRRFLDVRAALRPLAPDSASDSDMELDA